MNNKSDVFGIGTFIGSFINAAIPIYGVYAFGRYASAHLRAVGFGERKKIRVIYSGLMLTLLVYPYYLYGLYTSQFNGWYDPLSLFAEIMLSEGVLYSLYLYISEYKIMLYWFIFSGLPAAINAYHFKKYNSDFSDIWLY